MTKPIDLRAAAAALGRKGGQSTSERKAAAARENGKRGGRPRKQTGDDMMTFQIDTKENWRRIIGAGVDVTPFNITIDGTWVEFDVQEFQAETVKTRLIHNGIDYEIAH